VDQLGVDRALIEQHGAVSEPVVRAMAHGVAARYGTQIALAITGIAGPGGDTPTKPLGLVWYAVLADDHITTLHYVHPGTREEVRGRAVQAALFLLYQRL
jgi:PncC family amidohydrolase